MDYDTWTKKALKQIEKIEPNAPFILKNLFEGYEWEALTAGERRLFGIHFSNEVKDGRIKNIEKIEKRQNNSAQYVKKESDK